MENEMAFQFKESIKILKKGKFIILWITLLFTTAGIGYSIYSSKSVYQSSTSLIAVNSLNDKSTSQIYDLINYQNIIITYSAIATSKTVLEKASENLNGSISLLEMQDSITAIAQDKTPMIIITAKGINAQNTLDMVNAVSDAFKDEVPNIYQSIKFQTLDKAELPKMPISKSMSSNIIAGFLIGILFSIFIVFLKDYLNTTFKDEEQVEKYLKLKIIGSIPRH